MKKTNRKILSLILALSMIATFAIPVFANPAKEVKKMTIELQESTNYRGKIDSSVPCSNTSFEKYVIVTESNGNAGNYDIGTSLKGFYEKVGDNLVETQDTHFEVGKEYVIKIEITKGNAEIAPGFENGGLTVNLKSYDFETKLDVNVIRNTDAKYTAYATYVGRTWKELDVTGGYFLNGSTCVNVPVGQEILIKPSIPYLFKSWTVSSGKLPLTDEQKQTKELSFVMPNNSLKIDAINSASKTEAVPLTKIPRDYQLDERLDSLEKVKAILTKALKDKYKDSIGEIEFYDITPLKYNLEARKWVPIENDDELYYFLDRNDKIELLLPYPKGTNKDDYRFFVSHLITVSRDESLYATAETPEVINTDEGILIRTVGASPFAIAYENIEKPAPAATKQEPGQVADTDASFPSLLLALPAISAVGIAIAKKGRKYYEE